MVLVALQYRNIEEFLDMNTHLPPFKGELFL